jgi:hypothetical protein
MDLYLGEGTCFQRAKDGSVRRRPKNSLGVFTFGGRAAFLLPQPLPLVSFNESDGILFDREINGYQGSSFSHYELGFIGQPDVVSTRRRQGRGSDNLARQALALGADTDDRGDRHFELVILRHS